MYVKYIKSHPVGIEKGTCVDVEKQYGERSIKEGYVLEIKEKEYKDYVDKIRKSEKAKFDKIQEEQKKLLKDTQAAHKKAEKERVEKENSEMSAVERAANEKAFEKFRPFVAEMIANKGR